MADYSGSGDRIRWLLSAGLALALSACASRAPLPAPVPEAPLPETMPTAAAEPLAPPMPIEAAPVVQVRADAPLRYVVQPGDTLWGIARRFLNAPWQWPEVWYVNEQVANPHLIYPGDVLVLRYRNGRPELVRDEDYRGDRLLRLGPQIREIPLDQAIPAIPIEAIRDFLTSPRLVDADELNRAPYLLAFAEDQLIAGANSPAYVKNLPPESDYRWAIVRPDVPIVDPDTRKTLGFAATPVGGMEIREYTEPAAYGWITRSEIEVRVGDRLIPIDDALFDARFQPRAPAHAVGGTVVWLADQRLQATQYQVVAINRGREHGIETGHLLTVQQRGRSVADPYTRSQVVLPELDIGTLMIFKVGEALSFGLVLESTRPVSANDGVERPSAL